MAASEQSWSILHQGVVPHLIVDEGKVTIEEERRGMLVKCPKDDIVFVRTIADPAILIEVGGDGTLLVLCPSCEKEYRLDLR